MSPQAAQEFLKTVTGDTASRGMPAFRHMAEQTMRWTKDGVRLDDDSTYREIGFANRDSFVGIMRNHAHDAFGAMLRDAQGKLEKGFCIDGFNGQEHPVQLIGRAVSMLMSSNQPLLSDSTYLRFGHTLQSFTGLWRTARADRLKQHLALMSSPNFFDKPQTAPLAEQVSILVWNDFEDLGLVMTDDTHWQPLPITRLQYVENVKAVLHVALPLLMEETLRTQGDPKKHWQAMRAAEKAIDMYGYYTQTEGSGFDVAKITFEDFDAAMLQAFAGYIDHYLPILSNADSWDRRGFRVARSLEAQVQEYGWIETGMLDPAFQSHGYASFPAFRNQAAMAYARSMVARVVDGTVKGDDAHTAMCEAYATLFEDLGHDPEDPKIYMQLGITKKGFNDRWAMLAGETVRAMYNELFDVALTGNSIIGHIGDLKIALDQCEKMDMEPGGVSREVMDEINRAAHIRKAGFHILEFMSSAQTSKALELYDQAKDALIDGDCNLTDDETMKVLGMGEAEALKLEQFGTVLALETLWRDMMNPEYDVRTRYESLAQFLHLEKNTLGLDLETSGLCARLGFENQPQLRQALHDNALKFSKPLFTEAQDTWHNNRKEAESALSYVTFCLSLNHEKSEGDDMTFRRVFGFARGAYRNMVAQTRPNGTMQKIPAPAPSN